MYKTHQLRTTFGSWDVTTCHGYTTVCVRVFVSVCCVLFCWWWPLFWWFAAISHPKYLVAPAQAWYGMSTNLGWGHNHSDQRDAAAWPMEGLDGAVMSRVGWHDMKWYDTIWYNLTWYTIQHMTYVMIWQDEMTWHVNDQFLLKRPLFCQTHWNQENEQKKSVLFFVVVLAV